ncbi:creatininase family protein [Amycolatopsis sp. H20-H5]|uniref:creatininase family protein n=1 Tax=Amycolatopsis sp. H20-H5 TaxID=3046309 RepID=UPI002DBEF30F|nr:creatininase family protein [Amycolatopsis sp. H20-H5]MEC3980757.1 creatininase family protein [Amycolatopsis sp. H20-H5]
MTYFADLTSRQVAALHGDARVPVLLLPLGAVEPHGPHAPLGTDQLISRGMCERAAARLAADRDVHVVILPELPYGVTRFAGDFPGTVSIGEETLHTLLIDVCGALISQGFPHILLVNNHFEPAHLSTLRRVVETTESLHGKRIGHLDLVRRRYAERLTDEFRSGACHAGRYETSLVLADRPELVDTETMRRLPEVPVDLPAAMRAGAQGFLDMGMTDAYCGAPAEATTEEGQDTFTVLTELLVEAIRELGSTS